MNQVGPNDGQPHPYVLGHSDHEIDRLKAQARIMEPITRRILVDAGIAPGMRVLDVGSGAGDVSFLAADLVGDSGEVVGVDLVPAVVELARARAEERSLRNVSFRAGDPVEMVAEQSFDAVLGRYVLQFQKDPAAMLRALAARVRPGGVVVFHEIEWSDVRSDPPCQLYEQCRRWGRETMRLHGTETRMGTRLYSTFVAAGLRAPTMRLEALVGGGANSADVVYLLTSIMRTLLPEMERLGVTTASEVGLETLFERMSNEVVASSSVLVGTFQVGAWTRV
jgi:ubiquinone/menaquinone biosynthesis C-methylase UbiE